MRRLIVPFGMFSSTISTQFLTIAWITYVLLAAARQVGYAQSTPNDVSQGTPYWAIAAHAEAMRVPTPVDTAASPETIPPTIPKDSTNADPTGEVETYNPGGPTDTSTNAFFQTLDTNGRSCFSCHQPQDGWTITPTDATARFNKTKGTDPVFVPFDGATCFNDKVATLAEKRTAYKLLLTKGLIRIALPIPSSPQFEISSVKDPYKCTALTSPTTGLVSIYRRPLPATNLANSTMALFESTIMWDGREDSMTQQAIDATEIHGQTNNSPSAGDLSEIVGFETGTYTAQLSNKVGKLSLTAAGASGGAMALSMQLFIPDNDPITNPGGFSDNVFDLYTAWDSISGKTAAELMQESVARGEKSSTP
jgi:cytochrome c peroxidase